MTQAAEWRGLPSFHDMVAAVGGAAILCAPYTTFGGEALSRPGRRPARLPLANHGQIACDASLAKALELAREVEMLARQYLLALQAGEPVLLDAAEMARVLEKLSTYG